MVGQLDTLRLHLPEGQEIGPFVEALQALPDVRQVTAARIAELVLLVPERARKPSRPSSPKPTGSASKFARWRSRSRIWRRCSCTSRGGH